MNRRSGAEKTWRKILISLLCVFFSVSFFAVIFACLWLSKIQAALPEQKPAAAQGDAKSPDYGKSSGGQAEKASGENLKPDFSDSEAPFGKSGVLNILLVGWEKGSDSKERKPEAIMLLSYDSSKGLIRTVAFLRELYVSVPGHGSGRLDEAFKLGGSALLAETIEKEFGLKADGRFEAELEKLAEIIDYMGGVDLSLTSEEAKALDLKSGAGRINGDKALAYSRVSGGGPDFEGTMRQRKLMNQALIRISELKAAEKLRFLEKLLPCLATDMPRQRIASLFLAVLKNGVAGIDQSRFYIPYAGAYRSVEISGTEALVPDIEKNRALLKRWLYSS